VRRTTTSNQSSNRTAKSERSTKWAC